MPVKRRELRSLIEQEKEKRSEPLPTNKDFRELAEPTQKSEQERHKTAQARKILYPLRVFEPLPKIIQASFKKNKYLILCFDVLGETPYYTQLKEIVENLNITEFILEKKIALSKLPVYNLKEGKELNIKTKNYFEVKSFPSVLCYKQIGNIGQIDIIPPEEENLKSRIRDFFA